VTTDGATVIERATRAVAAFGTVERAGTVEVDTEEGAAFERRIVAEKLTGLAIAAITGGALRLPPNRVDSLLGRHRRAMAWCLMVEERLLQLDDRFRWAGIDYAVVKGPAIAHTAYPDPSLRAFGDLDILVRGGSFGDACTILREMGFRRRLAEPRPRFDERFGKAASHKHAGDSIEIDLHRTLVLGPFGLWLDPGAMLDRATSFELAGREIGRLDDTDMLISVAMHAVLGWPRRLLPLRDVVQAARVLDVDRHALARRASASHLTAVLLRAFELTSATLGVELAAVAEDLATTPILRSERRALDSYAGSRRGRGGTAVSTMLAIRGVREKAAYMRAVALPRRAFMRDRYPAGTNGTYRHRLAIPAGWVLRRASRN
jgi:putative nucleotidyltransferase-like protein